VIVSFGRGEVHLDRPVSAGSSRMPEINKSIDSVRREPPGSVAMFILAIYTIFEDSARYKTIGRLGHRIMTHDILAYK
jgi:hypothetical protein